MAYFGTRRKVFLSYHRGDRTEVNEFVRRFADQEKVFTSYILGEDENDEKINSDDAEYVISRIRQDYLQDTTVTIVMMGNCTHSRRFIDWEMKASLRQGEMYIPNGLLGIVVPSLSQIQQGPNLPSRFSLNWNQAEKECYARYHWYPSTADQLGSWIEDAFSARTNRARFINNPRETMTYNGKCKIHGITH